MVEIHEDLDQPGSRADRPGLIAAMDRVRAGDAGGIVVWRLDRFGRSAVDNARLLDELRQLGAGLYTVAEGIDTSSGPMGEFMASIFSAFAKLELDRIRDNWRSARERAVARGVHVSSKPPTGYVKGDDARLTPGPAAKAIRQVFQAKATGASWSELAAILEQAGIKTPYDGTNWSARSLMLVTRNRVYLGEARSGEFINTDAHEPIVDEDLWRRAQRSGPTPVGRSEALLAGVLRCAGCRFTMKADKVTNRRGERVRIYRCRGHAAGGRCEARATVLGSLIEPWVVERFTGHVGRLKVDAMAATDGLADAEAEVRVAEAELTAYRDSGAAAILGRRFTEGLTARAERLSEAETELTTRRRMAGIEELPDGAELDAVWDDLTTRERNRILRGAIDAVFLRSVGRRNVPVADRALVLWTGEAPASLPTRGGTTFTPHPFTWD